jgi:hypothetical protein
MMGTPGLGVVVLSCALAFEENPRTNTKAIIRTKKIFLRLILILVTSKNKKAADNKFRQPGNLLEQTH